jgi:hypothetical protein
MVSKTEMDILYNKNGGLSLDEYIEMIEQYLKDILNDWYWYKYDDDKCGHYGHVDYANNGILDIIKFFRYLKVKEDVDKASVLRKVFIDYHNYNNELAVLYFMPDAYDDYTYRTFHIYDRMDAAKNFSENIGSLIDVLSCKMTIDSYVDKVFPNLAHQC